MAQNYISSTVTSPGAKLPILPLARIPRPQNKSSSPSSSSDSNDTPAPSTRRSRIGKPKVKTGCITCKIRRVKCDEAKPECERCTTTGRKCDGYLTHPPKKTPVASETDSAELVVSRSINWEQGDLAERRAIDFFRHRTAPSVSSYFDTDFWTSLVMQVSQSEPAVRHALVAVGALNERRDLYVKDITYSRSVVTMSGHNVEASIREEQQQHNDPFALSQYNKAIAHLARAINSTSSNSIDTALLVCILFVCVECLRGDYKPALKHFQGGMSIALAAAGPEGPNSQDSQTTAIRKKLLPFFNRLELLGQVYGHRPSYEYGLEPSQVLPQTFHSIVEARDSIVHLMNLSIRLIHMTKFSRYSNKITPAERLYHSNLVNCLHTWKHTLDHFLLAVPPSPRLTEAATVLQIQQIVCRTWLNRSLVPEECAADADIPLYERAVSLGESLSSNSNGTQSVHPSTFLFDMETVSPLYLIAIKCRHPLIRRRAIALLRRSVRREGLWDSGKAAAIAERIVELEEVELQVLDGSELPREEVRIANAHIDSGPGLNPSGHKVTFYTMPEGVRGRWHTWDEWLELRP